MDLLVSAGEKDRTGGTGTGLKLFPSGRFTDDFTFSRARDVGKDSPSLLGEGRTEELLQFLYQLLQFRIILGTKHSAGCSSISLGHQPAPGR